MIFKGSKLFRKLSTLFLVSIFSISQLSLGFAQNPSEVNPVPVQMQNPTQELAQLQQYKKLHAAISEKAQQIVLEETKEGKEEKFTSVAQLIDTRIVVKTVDNKQRGAVLILLKEKVVQTYSQDKAEKINNLLTEIWEDFDDMFENVTAVDLANNQQFTIYLRNAIKNNLSRNADTTFTHLATTDLTFIRDLVFDGYQFSRQATVVKIVSLVDYIVANCYGNASAFVSHAFGSNPHSSVVYYKNLYEKLSSAQQTQVRELSQKVYNDKRTAFIAELKKELPAQMTSDTTFDSYGDLLFKIIMSVDPQTGVFRSHYDKYGQKEVYQLMGTDSTSERYQVNLKDVAYAIMVFANAGMVKYAHMLGVATRDNFGLLASGTYITSVDSRVFQTPSVGSENGKPSIVTTALMGKAFLRMAIVLGSETEQGALYLMKARQISGILQTMQNANGSIMFAPDVNSPKYNPKLTVFKGVDPVAGVNEDYAEDSFVGVYNLNRPIDEVYSIGPRTANDPLFLVHPRVKDMYSTEDAQATVSFLLDLYQTTTDTQEKEKIATSIKSIVGWLKGKAEQSIQKDIPLVWGDIDLSSAEYNVAYNEEKISPEHGVPQASKGMTSREYIKKQGLFKFLLSENPTNCPAQASVLWLNQLLALSQNQDFTSSVAPVKDLQAKVSYSGKEYQVSYLVFLTHKILQKFLTHGLEYKDSTTGKTIRNLTLLDHSSEEYRKNLVSLMDFFDDDSDFDSVAKKRQGYPALTMKFISGLEKLLADSNQNIPNKLRSYYEEVLIDMKQSVKRMVSELKGSLPYGTNPDEGDGYQNVTPEYVQHSAWANLVVWQEMVQKNNAVGTLTKERMQVYQLIGVEKDAKNLQIPANGMYSYYRIRRGNNNEIQLIEKATKESIVADVSWVRVSREEGHNIDAESGAGAVKVDPLTKPDNVDEVSFVKPGYSRYFYVSYTPISKKPIFHRLVFTKRVYNPATGKTIEVVAAKKQAQTVRVGCVIKFDENSRIYYIDPENRGDELIGYVNGLNVLRNESNGLMRKYIRHKIKERNADLNLKYMWLNLPFEVAKSIISSLIGYEVFGMETWIMPLADLVWNLTIATSFISEHLTGDVVQVFRLGGEEWKVEDILKDPDTFLDYLETQKNTNAMIWHFVGQITSISQFVKLPKNQVLAALIKGQIISPMGTANIPKIFSLSTKGRWDMYYPGVSMKFNIRTFMDYVKGNDPSMSFIDCFGGSIDLASGFRYFISQATTDSSVLGSGVAINAKSLINTINRAFGGRTIFRDAPELDDIWNSIGLFFIFPINYYFQLKDADELVEVLTTSFAFKIDERTGAILEVYKTKAEFARMMAGKLPTRLEKYTGYDDYPIDSPVLRDPKDGNPYIMGRKYYQYEIAKKYKLFSLAKKVKDIETGRGGTILDSELNVGVEEGNPLEELDLERILAAAYTKHPTSKLPTGELPILGKQMFNETQSVIKVISNMSLLAYYRDPVIKQYMTTDLLPWILGGRLRQSPFYKDSSYKYNRDYVGPFGRTFAITNDYPSTVHNGYTMQDNARIGIDLMHLAYQTGDCYQIQRYLPTNDVDLQTEQKEYRDEYVKNGTFNNYMMMQRGYPQVLLGIWRRDRLALFRESIPEPLLKELQLHAAMMKRHIVLSTLYIDDKYQGENAFLNGGMLENLPVAQTQGIITIKTETNLYAYSFFKMMSHLHSEDPEDDNYALQAQNILFWLAHMYDKNTNTFYSGVTYNKNTNTLEYLPSNNQEQLQLLAYTILGEDVLLRLKQINIQYLQTQGSEKGETVEGESKNTNGIFTDANGYQHFEQKVRQLIMKKYTTRADLILQLHAVKQMLKKNPQDKELQERYQSLVSEVGTLAVQTPYGIYFKDKQDATHVSAADLSLLSGLSGLDMYSINSSLYEKVKPANITSTLQTLRVNPLNKGLELVREYEQRKANGEDVSKLAFKLASFVKTSVILQMRNVKDFSLIPSIADNSTYLTVDQVKLAYILKKTVAIDPSLQSLVKDQMPRLNAFLKYAYKSFQSGTSDVKEVGYFITGVKSNAAGDQVEDVNLNNGYTTSYVQQLCLMQSLGRDFVTEVVDDKVEVKEFIERLNNYMDASLFVQDTTYQDKSIQENKKSVPFVKALFIQQLRKHQKEGTFALKTATVTQGKYQTLSVNVDDIASDKKDAAEFVKTLLTFLAGQPQQQDNEGWKLEYVDNVNNEVYILIPAESVVGARATSVYQHLRVKIQNFSSEEYLNTLIAQPENKVKMLPQEQKEQFAPMREPNLFGRRKSS